MKETKIYGQLIYLEYNRKAKQWVATFGEKELRTFARKIKKEAIKCKEKNKKQA